MNAPSPNLIDTLAICERRQEWYRNYAIGAEEDPVPLVGSLTTESTIEESAAAINTSLRFDLDERRDAVDWDDALRLMTQRVEDAGVLLMVNGVVGSNTHRKLDPNEFRGFVLVDELAPLVFVNGADAKAAQIFTLCHELAHVALGQSALSNPTLTRMAAADTEAGRIERWCDRVAAEMLIPRAALDQDYQADQPLETATARLSRRYKVSRLVVLRRLFDTHRLSRETFDAAYAREMQAIVGRERRSSGGDYYRSQPIKVSRRFARALIRSTVAGETLYRDAYRLLAVKTHGTFEELGRTLGVL